MEYFEAIKLRNESLKLIGTRDPKGFEVGDIILVPIEKKARDAFFGTYLLTFDAMTSIVPFADSDIEVIAIDLNHLRQSGILFYNRLGI